MKQIIDELREAEVGTLLENEPLSRYTTWKIGGPADLMVIPAGKSELIQTIQILRKHNQTWTKIGRGSNLLVSDNGIRGVVIKLGKPFEQIRFDNEFIYVGGAYSFVKLAFMASKQGLSGLEFAGGIPGTVGGAVYMNAGAHGSDMSRILHRAEVVLETGELAMFNNEELQFDYRHSLLQSKPGIVTEAVLKLEKGDHKLITEKMLQLRDYRLNTQPLQLPCAGSVFRNPLPQYAAKLIEDAGLKGLQVGGAEVSTLHANFIVNKGHATAKDVLTLIEHIKQVVKDKYDVQLVPEVLMAGER